MKKIDELLARIHDHFDEEKILPHLDTFIGRQVDAFVETLPPPPEGKHYRINFGDIVYKPGSNDWTIEMTPELVDNDPEP